MSEAGLGSALKRLSRQEGQWVLEVERLVPAGRHLHQPEAQTIEGAALIGKHMRQVPELAPMADATESLMREESGESFQIWKGAWLEEEMVQHLAFRSDHKAPTVASGPPVGGASRKAVAKLERLHSKLSERMDQMEAAKAGPLATQIADLLAAVEALGDRLGQVEKQLGLEVPNAPPGAAASVAQETVEGAASNGAEATPDAPVASAEADLAETAAETSPLDAQLSETDGVAENDAKAEAERPEKRLVLPSVVALRQSLSTLVGEEVAMKERGDRVDLGQGTFYQVLLHDDAGVAAGVMVADLEATVRLACRLLMLPEGEVESQLEAGEASEDSQETMREIFNTLSGTMNNVKNNPHISSSSMAVLDPSEFGWVETTKRRQDVELEGGGVILICAI